MNFGEALETLKGGEQVRRTGWNGATQFVTLIRAGNAMATVPGMGRYPMQDCLGLKNAQGGMQPGWVPSQGDLFAEDWEVV